MNIQEELQDQLDSTDAWRYENLAKDMVDYMEKAMPSLQAVEMPSLTPEQDEALSITLLKATAAFMDQEGLTAESIESVHRKACEAAVVAGAQAFHRGALLREGPSSGPGARQAEVAACWRNGWEEAELSDNAESGALDEEDETEL